MASSIRLREIIFESLSEVQLDSEDVQLKALQTLASITKVSPQNRNLLAQTEGAVITIHNLSKSSPSSTIQILSLAILFNLSLNPNLKRSLADAGIINHLNSVILSPTSPEYSRLTASLICSLAMLDKNKARFGVFGTIEVLLEAVSRRQCPASSHHLLSSLAELVHFHGNCTLAVRSGAIQVLMDVIDSAEGEDLAGTSLAILGLVSRFDEGLLALRKTEDIVSKMLEVLRGRCMLSKEGAAEILIRLFDESEGCVRDALRLPEFLSVLADLSVRGSGKAREKAGLLMRKLMEADVNSLADAADPIFSGAIVSEFAFL